MHILCFILGAELIITSQTQNAPLGFHHPEDEAILNSPQHLLSVPEQSRGETTLSEPALLSSFSRLSTSSARPPLPPSPCFLLLLGCCRAGGSLRTSSSFLCLLTRGEKADSERWCPPGRHFHSDLILSSKTFGSMVVGIRLVVVQITQPAVTKSLSGPNTIETKTLHIKINKQSNTTRIFCNFSLLLHQWNKKCLTVIFRTLLLLGQTF